MFLKKIIFLTGTRADFGKMKSIILRLKKNKYIKIQVFVTGMHLMKRYGSTVHEIKKSGIKNTYSFVNQTINDDMDMALSKTIKGFSNFVKNKKPDLIVVHGDRLEALAGAVVGLFNNILVAHIEGGEVSGTVDNSIRHAISKLCHIHFVSNQSHKKRLIQLGEIEKKIFIIGSPDIDIMNSRSLPSLSQVKRIYNIDFKKYSILIMHPVTTELEKISSQTNILMNSLKLSKKKYVIIYPNNDKGSQLILNTYKKYNKNKNFKIFRSMRFESFLTLLKNADFIIGNSSAGIREAPYYNVPSINLGSRQKNRYQNNLIKNTSFNKKLILKEINKLGSIKKNKVKKSFGTGQSAKKFEKIILNKNFWKTEIQKGFVDRGYFDITN